MVGGGIIKEEINMEKPESIFMEAEKRITLRYVTILNLYERCLLDGLVKIV